MLKYLRSGENLQDIIKADLYLVDFYADWCGPCKMFATVLEKIDFINILKINVDEHPEIAKEYGVMSIPTVCYFKNGEMVKKVIGFQTIEEVKETIKKIK
ncbi:MAG: thioredoxin [Bacilli bacterium]|nr:thioredoxin [Bacilli bacterium]